MKVVVVDHSVEGERRERSWPSNTVPSIGDTLRFDGADWRVVDRVFEPVRVHEPTPGSYPVGSWETIVWVETVRP
jgi:hypothetical protein